MPKPTIKALQATINELRELREGDKIYVNNLKQELEQAKKRISQVTSENEGLHHDKRWLKSLIQNLVPGDRNAIPR